MFSCLSPEALAEVSTAHRAAPYTLDTITGTGLAGVKDLLVLGGMHDVPGGGVVEVAGRTENQGALRLVLSGWRSGKPFNEEYTLELDANSPLAPRAFGEVAVRELDRLNDPTVEDLIVAYCQRFGIGSKQASFLVLERDSDYKRFGIEETRSGAGIDELTTRTLASRKSKPAGESERWIRFLEKAGLTPANRKEIADLIKRVDPAHWTPGGKRILNGLETKDRASMAYLQALVTGKGKIRTFVEEAHRRCRGLGRRDGAVRAFSTLLDLRPGDDGIRDTLAYKLMEWMLPGHAIPVLQVGLERRPFEPQPWLEMARAFDAAGKPGPAVVCYEVTCRGKWHRRFAHIQGVVREEYREFLLRSKKEVAFPFRDLAQTRLGGLGGQSYAGVISVTATWNTDNTDVDLWVIEPGGEKCFYKRPRTSTGSRLSSDLREGYGPERYVAKKATSGEYKVLAHYYRANRNRMGGATSVRLRVVIGAGTPQETQQVFTVVLDKSGEAREACRIVVSKGGGIECVPSR
jgi:hypothetical protein